MYLDGARELKSETAGSINGRVTRVKEGVCADVSAKSFHFGGKSVAKAIAVGHRE